MQAEILEEVIDIETYRREKARFDANEAERWDVKDVEDMREKE